jgi:hypothetical protein
MEKRKNVGLTYGLIGGLALSVYFILMYLGGVEFFMGPLSWLGYVIIIVIAVLAGLKQRKLNGGSLEFGEALKVVFLVFALGFLLQTITSHILFNYIDVPFKDAMTQKALEKTEDLLKRFGASQDQIDKALEDAAKRDSFSIKSQLLGYGVTCILFFLVSLIIAAIIKRKPAPFENSFNQA